MAANYTRLIEFKVKDTELNRAVNNLSKTLNKIDKTLVGIDKKLETIAKTRFKDIEKEAVKVEKSMARIGRVYKKMLTPKGVARGAVSGVFGLIGLNKKAIADTAIKIGFLDAVVRRFTKREYGLGKAIAETTGAIGKAVSALDRYARSATDLIKTHSRLIDATGKLGLALGTVAAFTPQLYAAGKAWRQLEYDIRRVGRALRDSGPRGVGALFPKGSMIGKWGRRIEAGEEAFAGEKIDRAVRKEQLSSWRKMGEHPGNIKSHVEGLTKVNKILGDNQKIQEGINAFTQRHVQATIAVRKAQIAVNHELLRAKATQALFNADIWMAQRAWTGLVRIVKGATGVLGGLLGGKAGQLGQAAAVVGISDAVKRLSQHIPFVSQAWKDNIQVFATWTQRVTEGLAAATIAHTVFSKAIGGAQWVTGAVSGFITWEKQAALSFQKVNQMRKNLDRDLASWLGGGVNPFKTGGKGGGPKRLGMWDKLMGRSLDPDTGAVRERFEDQLTPGRLAGRGQGTLERQNAALERANAQLARLSTSSDKYATALKKVLMIERQINKETQRRKALYDKANPVAREKAAKQAVENAINAAEKLQTAELAHAKNVKQIKAKMEDSLFQQKLAKEEDLTKKELANDKKVNDAALRNFDRRLAGRQRRREAGSRFRENLMLGAGFPLLFGGGVGSVGGGVLGAGVQSAMGSKGFGMQILFSALGQQLDAIAARAITTAKAFTSLDGAFALMNERTLWSSDEVQKHATTLQKQGKSAKLAALLTKEYAKILGSDGIRKMQELAEKSKEAAKQWGILRTQLELLLSGPLKDLMGWINMLLGKQLSSKSLNERYSYFRDTGQTDKAKELKRLVMAERKPVLNPLSFFLQGGGLNIGGGPDAMGVPSEKIAEILARPQFAMPKTSTASIPSVADPTKGAELEATLKAEIAHLQEVGRLGRQEAEIRREINKLEEQGVENAGKLVREKYHLQDQLERTQALYSEIAQTIQDGMVNAIEGLILKTNTLKEAASDTLRIIARMMLQMGVSKLMVGMGFPEYANGGPVTGGKSILVGERGPEIFTPKRSGAIVPNDKIGGGGSTSVVVNVDATGGSAVQGDEPSAQQLGRMIGAAVQAEIVKQKRPGGILA